MNETHIHCLVRCIVTFTMIPHDGNGCVLAYGLGDFLLLWYHRGAPLPRVAPITDHAELWYLSTAGLLHLVQNIIYSPQKRESRQSQSYRTVWMAIQDAVECSDRRTRHTALTLQPRGLHRLPIRRRSFTIRHLIEPLPTRACCTTAAASLEITTCLHARTMNW